jgi:hypothetical protein
MAGSEQSVYGHAIDAATIIYKRSAERWGGLCVTILNPIRIDEAGVTPKVP